MISSEWVSPKVILTGRVLWVTSHYNNPSSEVVLRGARRGVSRTPRYLASLEFMKLASVPESSIMAWE